MKKSTSFELFFELALHLSMYAYFCKSPYYMFIFFFYSHNKNIFLSLPLNTPPELQRTDLCLTVLQLKALGIDNIVQFDFPSAPPSRNLISAIELLYALGAIDDSGSLTKPVTPLSRGVHLEKDADRAIWSLES